MLAPQEISAVAEQFGVSPMQVRRDHLISLLLGLLSQEVADDVLFFGGTALARTHLPDGRLSEDIDLIVRDGRSRSVVGASWRPRSMHSTRRVCAASWAGWNGGRIV